MSGDRLSALLSSLDHAPAPSAAGLSDAEILPRARAIVIKAQKASASHLQRHLKVGYNFAARLIETLQAEGVVGPPDHVGRRAVLVSAEGEPTAEAVPADEPEEGSPVEELAIHLIEKFGLDRARRLVGAAIGGTIDSDVMTALAMAEEPDPEAVELVRVTLRAAAPDVQADHLRQIVERIESLFAQRDELAATIREVFAFAKAIGFDPPMLRAVVKARAVDPTLRKEKEAMLEVYRHALGIEGPDFVIPLPSVSVPPPPKAKKITAKEKSYREVLALTAATRVAELS